MSAMSTSVATTTTTAMTTEQTVQPRKVPVSHAGASKLASDAPQAEGDNFFWTYTEEPHRSRRQAIIKAHPEVRWTFATFSIDLLTITSTGPQAMWSRAFDDSYCAGGGLAPIPMCLPPSQQPLPLVALLLDGVHHRRHGEPESLSGNP